MALLNRTEAKKRLAAVLSFRDQQPVVWPSRAAGAPAH